MRMVLTLIVNPEKSTKAGDLLNYCAQIAIILLQKLDLSFESETLAEGEAIDIYFKASAEIHAQIQTRLNIEYASLSCDWHMQPVAGRRKTMLIADMDKTMIGQECIDELADFMGIKDKVSTITEAAMRGEVDFDEALTARVALLAGMHVQTLEQCFVERISVSPGAYSLVRTMADAGHTTALVSGGFTFFTQRIADRLGFGLNRANQLDIQAGALTGKILDPICNAKTKEDTLVEISDEQNIEPNMIMAVGDGANDIPMILRAGLGVAYHAKPKASAAADFSVKHCDLSALLFVQGYPRSEFIIK